MGSNADSGRRSVAFEFTLQNVSVVYLAKVSWYVQYLFTFWPPGPEDLLKDTSQMLFGMVSASKVASQRLAASSSPSPFSPPSDAVFGLAASRRVEVQNEVGVRVTVLGRRMAMGRNIMARVERVQVV